MKPLLQVKLSKAGIPTLVSLYNLEIEYHVSLLKLLEKDPSNSPPPTPAPASVPLRTEPLSESISTVCDTELSIPIHLSECVVGLAPLHLPSHACLLISTGTANVKIAQLSGEFGATVNITRASLLMIDDKKYISSMGGVAATERRRGSGAGGGSHDLALLYLGQGYVSVAIISGVAVEISAVPERQAAQKPSAVTIGLTVDSVYMKSTADSTHSLIQLLNDLKPPVETPPPELKYRTTTSAPINLMADVDPHRFSAETMRKMPFNNGDDEGGDTTADFVNDDVPTNLEFIESYYADHIGRSQWNGAASSSGSLTTSYSNTDLLLEEDLSAMVARNNLDKRGIASSAQPQDSLLNPKVLDYYADAATMPKLATSYEQRVKSHDPILNFEENHFGGGSARKSQSLSQPSSAKSVSRQGARHSGSLPSTLEHDDSDSTSEIFNSIQASSFSQIGGGNGSTSEMLPGSSFNTYQSTDSGSARPPILIEFEVRKFTWDMHDGYDWRYTRDMITKAVFRVEYEAQEIRKIQDEEEQQVKKLRQQKQQQQQQSGATIQSDDEDGDLEEEEGEDVVADVLFNSIYITMSTHQDSNDLRKMINQGINANDAASDTMSVTSMSNNTTSYAGTVSAPPSRVNSPYKPSPSLARELRHAGSGKSKLKLKRSKSHKVRIHLTGIHGTMSLFAGVGDDPPSVPPANPDSQFLLNRIDVKVTDAEIFDNVATSTWNKFLTYMRSAGEREEGASMFHLIIENVKPVLDIPTSEIVLNVFVLPLRLHVDQDTLDFITRFFEFQDDRFDSLVAGLQDEIPFIQKVDIRAVKVKLDYKPKKVDYAGLRSGHTTEFMNFFILEEAEMVLNHVKLYGISGFPRLNTMLNGVWMPDIRRNQLGDVLAGLAPVRSIVRLGTGLKDLVVVPVREYKKDGRVMRSLQKGAWQFARTTTSELVKFGAKLAAGTQTILENAEQAMGGAGSAGRRQPPRRSGSARKPAAYADGLSDSEESNGSDGGVDEATAIAMASSSVQPRRGVHFRDDEPSKPSTAPSSSSPSGTGGDGGASAGGPPNAVSLYANQPVGVMQGIRTAYGSMGHNLSIARDAVADISTEAAETGSMQGAAMAVMRAAPIAIIRPMIGATEAVSKTLLGVTNQMDPDQIGYMEEKYRAAAKSKSQSQSEQQQNEQQAQGKGKGGK